MNNIVICNEKKIRWADVLLNEKQKLLITKNYFIFLQTLRRNRTVEKMYYLYSASKIEIYN